MSLALWVVGKGRDDLDEFVMRHDGDPAEVYTLLLENGTQMRLGGQARIWEEFVLTSRNVDVVGMVHADTYLSPGFLASVERACLSGPVVAGLVGRALSSFYVWSSEVLADTEVSALDGCSVFASLATSRLPGVRFDGAVFDGFHCAVEDFCLSAARAGCRVVVPPGEASHIGASANDPAWLRQYGRYRYALAEKWLHTLFLTT